MTHDEWRRAIDGEDAPPCRNLVADVLKATAYDNVVVLPNRRTREQYEATWRRRMREMIGVAVDSGRPGVYRRAARKIKAMPLPEAQRVADDMMTVAAGIKQARAAR